MCECVSAKEVPTRAHRARTVRPESSIRATDELTADAPLHPADPTAIATSCGMKRTNVPAVPFTPTTVNDVVSFTTANIGSKRTTPGCSTGSQDADADARIASKSFIAGPCGMVTPVPDTVTSI